LRSAEPASDRQFFAALLAPFSTFSLNVLYRFDFVRGS
jgi:hypothetical protein